MKVVFRTDASSQIGIGHVMRCLTLASELHNHGCEAFFVCRDLPGNMISYISSKGFPVFPLPMDSKGDDVGAYDWEVDASMTKGIVSDMERVDWLVVDHYQLDAKWEEQLRGRVASIMVVDDLADRRHNCDLLLDQNYYADMNSRYKGMLEDECVTLLGPEHVLLREEFREALPFLNARDGDIKRVLIFLGGGDPDNVTMKAIEAVRMLGRENLFSDVVVGSSNQHREDIEIFCKTMPNVDFHCQTEKMAMLMAKADICLGAGGATTWERGVLGLPSMTIVCADNQYMTTRDLANIGAVFYLGRSEDVSAESICRALDGLMRDSEAVLKLSENMIGLMGNLSKCTISTSAEYMIKKSLNDV